MKPIQKILRCAVLAAVTLTLCAGAAHAAYGTGTVTASSLYLRKGPGTGYAALGGARRGVEVEVLEDAADGWYKVALNGKVGYMSAQYLSVTPAPVEEPAPEPSAVPEESAEPAAAPEETLEEPAAPGEAAEAAAAPEETAEAAPAQLCGIVTASTLNVRSGPGLDQARIGSLSRGSTVTVEEQLDGWCRITAGKTQGYVSAKYLALYDLNETQAAGAQIVELASSLLGTPYLHGGTTPAGFDCSGFVYYVYRTLGYSAPRTGTSMWNKYPHVEGEALMPGDVVCFTGTSSTSTSYITHVGLYVGSGQFIHSSTPSSGGVILSSLSEKYYANRYVGAVRML